VIIIPPSGVGGGTDGIFDGLGLFSIQRATSISDEDRKDLLGTFCRDCCVQFHVLFTTITDENKLGLWETVEDIDHSLAF
jgi:hypothetical protein